MTWFGMATPHSARPCPAKVTHCVLDVSAPCGDGPGSPMPTWASRIMLTSFAPSPMASVIGCSLENLINLTIWKRKKWSLSSLSHLYLGYSLGRTSRD